MADQPGGPEKPRLFGPRGEDLAALAAQERARAEAIRKQNEALKEQIALGEELSSEIEKQRSLEKARADEKERAINMSAREMRDAGISAAVQKQILDAREKMTTSERESASISRTVIQLQKLSLDGITEESVQRAVGYAAATNQLSVLQGMVQEQSRLKAIIESTSPGVSEKEKKEAGEQLDKLKRRHGQEIEAMGTAEGRAAKVSQKAATPTSAASMVESGGMYGLAGWAARLIPGLTKLGAAQREAAAGNAALSTGQLAASIGIDAMAGALGGVAKMLPIIESFSSIGNAFKMLLDIFDEGRKTGGRSLQALSMRSGEAWNNVAAQSFGAAEEIRQSSGLSMQSISIMGNAFYSTLVPAAQSAMMTFNSFDEDVNKFAGRLINVGTAASRMGIDVNTSMKMAVEGVNAFGVSGDDMQDVFESSIRNARAARLTIDQFRDSIGSAVEIGKRFGDQSGMYGEMGRQIGGIKGISAVQKQLLAETISGMTMNPMKLLAFHASAVGDEKAATGLIKAVNEGGEGKGGIMSYSAMGIHEVLSREGILDKLKYGTNMERVQAAQAAAKLTGKEALGTALLNKNLVDVFEQVGASGMNKERSKLIEDALAENGDVAAKGAKAMASQMSSLEIIAGAATALVKMVGFMSMSWLFKATTSQKAEFGEYAASGGKNINALNESILDNK